MSTNDLASSNPADHNPRHVTRWTLGLLLVGVTAVPHAAHAEPERPSPELGVSYLWDGGALPFFWVALAGDLAINRWVPPRATPLGFSASEGGAPVAPWEVPDWAVLTGGGVVAATMALAGDASGLDHAKGLAESLATSALITQTLKVTFGRHRPDYTPGGSADERKSFPSGHATEAFAIATYAGLYLHEHVFDRMHEPGVVVGASEGLAYAGLALGAGALAFERGYHNRHFTSDILVGSALGTATSTAFFLYQEHRFRNRGGEAHALALVPTPTSDGAVLQLGGEL